MVAGTISLPSKGFFSPFPRGTCSLSVAKEYLGLSSGLDRFAQSSTCTVLLGIPLGGFEPSRTRLSRSMAALSRAFRWLFTSHIKVPLPREDKSSRFRLFRFRSPLLTESLRFLFLGLLRCFTSPRFASPDYEFIRSILQNYLEWVVPFGDPRIKACLRLPVAYRNLLRPSSPLGTKAFTISP